MAQSSGNAKPLMGEAAPKKARRAKKRKIEGEEEKKVEENDAEGTSSGRPGNS